MRRFRKLRPAVSKTLSLTLAAFIVATMALSAALLPQPGLVLAQTQVVSIQRVSVPSTEGNGISHHASISADGRYLAFESYASNLVAGDTNGMSDVFVHDRQTGQTTRVSVDSAGAQGDYASGHPSISADGRYVAFYSNATNLVASDTNNASDVFVHDRQTGQTTRVSVPSDGAQASDGSYDPSISADGRHVAFISSAYNLADGDSNDRPDVFVHDRQTGQTTRVSVASDGAQGDDESYSPSISADGRYVAFHSIASNLVAGDTNGREDVFVHDQKTAQTTLVSASSQGAPGNDSSYYPSISADGRYVAYESCATNLVAVDTLGDWHILVHDRQTGTTTRVSVDSAGNHANDQSYAASISADGRYVAFESIAYNLVAGDTNGSHDIFIHDRQTGQTTRVSVDSDGIEGDSHSLSPSISADGRYVAFESEASNLVAGDSNGVRDVFVHDRQTQETSRDSAGWVGTEGNNHSAAPSISAYGRYVAFESDAENLVASDNNGVSDVFVRDRQTGVTARVSVDSYGVEGNFGSYHASISADGRYVAFQSAASNLVPSDSNGWEDIFVHDRQIGETTRVSVASDGTQGDLRSIFPSISADGRYVAFESYATTLVAGDSNGATDIFVHDRETGETARVSLTYDNAEGNGYSYSPIISADGHHVAFSSTASNMVLADNNFKADIFVRGLVMGETARVSVTSGGAEANGASSNASISADGQSVAFESEATNLVAGDSSIRPDIFVRDRQTGQTTRVSVSSDGAEGDGQSFFPCISADGRYVAFGSWAGNLVSGDGNGIYDIFVHDRQTAETTRVSVASSGTEGNDGSSNVSISADGRYVAFESGATNLVAGDTNDRRDVFVVSWQNPALAYSPTSIDFGARYQGSVASLPLQVQNSGTGTLSYSLSENGPWCSVSPASGDSSGETDNLSVTVDTSGLPVGSYSCVILIASDEGLGIVPVHLSVQPTPVIEVAPAGHHFGVVAPGSTADQVFTVSNSGTADLIIGTVAGADPVAAPYSKVSDSCSGQTIPPGGNGTVTIRFSPTIKGSFSDSFDVPSNDPKTPSVTVTLIGATPNTAPMAPVVAITPDNPGTAAELVCAITTQSTDADGDTVTYTYQWYKDDVLQSSLTTNTVAAAETAKGQVWKCVVTPTDGTDSGASGEDEVTIQNSVPAAPVVAVTPASPRSSDDLVCGITTQSTDADGDTVTYTYQWYKDDLLQSGLTTNTVDAAETAKGQVWKCVVTPSDGTVSGPSAEDEVTVTGSAGGFPAGAIAGMVIGVLVLLAAAAFFWFRRSKKAPPVS